MKPQSRLPQPVLWLLSRGMTATRSLLASSPEATFLFYNLPHRLETREEYLREWLRWEAEDEFHLEGCTSSERRVQSFGGFALLTHTVRTELANKEGRQTLHERETIVFRAWGGGLWAAVHERLSRAN